MAARTEIQFTVFLWHLSEQVAAGGRFNICVDDSLQQQHHFLVILLQRDLEHTLRSGVCPYLLCGITGWRDGCWAHCEEDWPL